MGLTFPMVEDLPSHPAHGHRKEEAQGTGTRPTELEPTWLRDEPPSRGAGWHQRTPGPRAKGCRYGYDLLSEGRYTVVTPMPP